MNAEIVAIGTELLLGQVLDTNTQYLSKQLSFLGIDVYFQSVVGDNPARIKQALALAAERADLVICSGGIGPTQDDVTKEVLSELTGLSLLPHDPSLKKIEAYFHRTNRTMSQSNRKMALVLDQSTPFLNVVGQAAGLAVEHEGTYFVVLPGPPRELTGMFEQEVSPWLKSIVQSEETIYSKLLKFAGIGESNLEQALFDLIDQQEDPTLAPYANVGEVGLRISTKASSEAAALQKIQSVENEIRKIVGEHIYADTDITLEQAVVELMNEKGLTLSAAESCTGGLFSELITVSEGCSSMFYGSVICYSYEMKQQLLQVPSSVLSGPRAPGAVSAETAKWLAERVQKLTGTDFGVSITGVAGPASMENKPVGLVYVGLAQKGHEANVLELNLAGTRETIKLSAAKRALYELWQRLKEV